MSDAWSGFAAALLVAATWYAERAVDRVAAGLVATDHLRQELLIDPRQAVPRFCAAAAERAGQQEVCRSQLFWRQASDPSAYASVCDGTLPPTHADPRLVPRRYYQVVLDCAAVVPGLGRRRVTVELVR